MSPMTWLLACVLCLGAGYLLGLFHAAAVASRPLPISVEAIRRAVENAEQGLRERICRRRGHRLTPWRADRLQVCRRCGASEA